MTDTAAILRELAYVKAVFQLRAIVAVMGVAPGDTVVSASSVALSRTINAGSRLPAA